MNTSVHKRLGEGGGGGVGLLNCTPQTATYNQPWAYNRFYMGLEKEGPIFGGAYNRNEKTGSQLAVDRNRLSN